MADGSVETAVGIAFLAGGTVALIGQLVFPGAPEWVWGLQLLVWLVLAGHVGLLVARSRLEREAGYVEPLDRAGAATAGLVMGALFVGAVVLLRRGVPGAPSDLVFLLGSVLGLADLVAGGLVRQPRAVVRGIATIALTWWLVTEEVALDMAMLMGALALLFLVSGWLVRRRYRRRREARA